MAITLRLTSTWRGGVKGIWNHKDTKYGRRRYKRTFKWVVAECKYDNEQ
jgi:hypothetical protein